MREGVLEGCGWLSGDDKVTRGGTKIVLFSELLVP
jgi:hypothetical protein